MASRFIALRSILFSVLSIFAGTYVNCQPRPPGDSVYLSQNYFQTRYNAADKEYSFSARKEMQSFTNWGQQLLPRLKEILGITRLEKNLADYIPHAQMKSSEDLGPYIRQRWTIWTEPDMPLPMIILLPKNSSVKTPLVITPHGHGRNSELYAGIYTSEEEKDLAEKDERDIGIQAVNEGYIVIAPTARGFGETRTEADKKQDRPFSCRLQLMHDLLIGRTPIGDRVWDISKIIDWSIANLRIDFAKIAITGNSAGGTVSLFAAACDSRIAVAAPASYFSTFTGSIGSIAHCDCNYIPGILNLGEMSDVAGLIAPRPLYIVNGNKDEIYPIEEARIAFDQLREIYKAAGSTESVQMFEGDGGHRYYKAGVWPFIAKHFKGSRNIISGELLRTGMTALVGGSPGFQPFPGYEDRSRWDTVSVHVKESIISEGVQYLNYKWSPLPASVFLEYSVTGNRSNYEAVYFSRRHALSSLLLAECVEHSGRFLTDIMNGVWAICEESYWGLPAHLYLQKDSIGLPQINEPTVDLFAAETGNLLAWSHFFFKYKFDSISPLINRRIKDEVRRRVLTPNLEREDFWWMGFGERIPNNWNPWINANWLGCVLMLEDSIERKKQALSKIARSLDVFLNHYPADGGCDEGPGYWSYAGGALLDCLELLRTASGHAFDVYSHPLIKNIGAYLNTVRIEEDYFINFADASARVKVNPISTFLYGVRTGNLSLMSMGRSAAREQGVTDGNIKGDMFRKLQTFFHLDELSQPADNRTYQDDFFLPDLQVFGARSRSGSSKGFFVAGKGGHNNESHNHNDIGNFIIYYDGKPVLIDVGVETYTAKTFSHERYDIWTMQSAYHNLPFINGYMQSPGMEYTAQKVNFHKGKSEVEFSLDMQSAYPAAAAIQSWRRSMVLNRKRQFVKIRDEYELKEIKGQTFFTLMTGCRVLQKDDQIMLQTDSTNILIVYDRNRLRAEVEEIPVRDALLKRVWNDRIYRIKLNLSNPRMKDTVSIRVEAQ